VLWRDGRVIDLGVGVAEDVNGSGDGVGTQQDSNYVPHATLFRAGTAVRLAEPATAGETQANGINDAGLIVGSAGFPGPTGGTWHALVWSADTPGSVIDLGTLDGNEANGTRLVGVNEAGTLIGNAWDPNTSRQTAVIGTVHGGLRALRGSTRVAGTVANAIAGRYVAGIQYLNGGIQTVRWVNGRVQVLPGGAEANGVNSQGTVVGRRFDLITGLIWTGAADPVELPIPAGMTQAGAAAITDGARWEVTASTTGARHCRCSGPAADLPSPPAEAPDHHPGLRPSAWSLGRRTVHPGSPAEELRGLSPRAGGFARSPKIHRGARS
jgi:hypothetical protein